MNKIKTLKTIIIGLVLLNIALLAFAFYKPHPRPNQSRAEAKLKELFHFNDQQMDQFRTSREIHREQNKMLQEKLSDVAVKYYLSLDSLQKSANRSEVMAITQQIYDVNEKHIADIKKMAGNQKDAQVEEFIKSLIRLKQKPPQKGEKEN